MFSTYMTDYMPAIMREINSLYDVDGCSPTPGRRWARCRCAIASSAASCRPPGRSAYWDKFNERSMYLWKLYDSIAKEKKPGNFYFANLGGGIRCHA